MAQVRAAATTPCDGAGAAAAPRLAANQTRILVAAIAHLVLLLQTRLEY
jgi:hypothetical protein